MKRIWIYIIRHLNDIIIYTFLGYLFIYGVLRLNYQNIVYSYILILLLGIYIGYHSFVYRDRYLNKK